MGNSTTYLFSDATFSMGIGTVGNIAGNFYGFNYSKSPEEADFRAITSDWKMVGSDIRSALVLAESLPKCPPKK